MNTIWKGNYSENSHLKRIKSFQLMLRYHPQEDASERKKNTERKDGKKPRHQPLEEHPEDRHTIRHYFGWVLPCYLFWAAFFVMRIPDSPQTNHRPTIIYQFYSLGLDASNFYK